MLYQRRVFTCPASSGSSTSEMTWDRAFLSADQFAAKYGADAVYAAQSPLEIEKIAAL